MNQPIPIIDITGRDGIPEKPGEIAYYVNADKELAGLRFGCPCGCGQTGGVRFLLPNDRARRGWRWNGDKEKPTLKPSIRLTTGCGWHGYLTDGEFVEC